MAWRLAKSLETLRTQINVAAPRRSKASDGTIGDEAHAATKSDHNPLDHDHNPNTAGVVLAFDCTHDPAGGCDCNALAQSLVDSRDARIQYIIWNSRICNSEVSPWVWRPYSGSNPHTKHMHISIKKEERLFDDTKPWSFRLVAGPAPIAQPVTTTTMPAPGTNLTARPGAGPAVAVSGGFFVTAGAWAWNAFGWLGLATFIVGLIALVYVFRKPLGHLLFKRSK